MAAAVATSPDPGAFSKLFAHSVSFNVPGTHPVISPVLQKNWGTRRLRLRVQLQSVSNSLDSEPHLLASVIIVTCCQGPGSLNQGPHFHP